MTGPSKEAKQSSLLLLIYSLAFDITGLLDQLLNAGILNITPLKYDFFVVVTV